nr:MAG TPA: hypothetical protein [Caudoviricetes sp.]
MRRHIIPPIFTQSICYIRKLCKCFLNFYEKTVDITV